MSTEYDEPMQCMKAALQELEVDKCPVYPEQMRWFHDAMKKLPEATEKMTKEALGHLDHLDEEETARLRESSLETRAAMESTLKVYASAFEQHADGKFYLNIDRYCDAVLQVYLDSVGPNS